MRFVATTIIVLLSFCSITAVQAEQSNSCKQCCEQQQAGAKNCSAKTCKTRYLHERMPEKITNSRPIPRRAHQWDDPLNRT
jgi:hypothetical protein